VPGDDHGEGMEVTRFGVDLVGRTLGGRYRVDRKIGAGGMGAIYKGQDVELGVAVVVKVPHVRLLVEDGFLARFDREIRQLVHLDHPHVVRILGRGEEEGIPYFVLPFLEGGSLEDRLAAAPGRRQTVPETLLWLGPVAETLDFIHGRGVVHRDVKPANILFHATGTAYVSDFGIAKALAAGDSGLTMTGHGVGTPQYMAPEQAMGRDLSGAADQYALAATLYEALRGAPPFAGNTPLEIAVRKEKEPPPPIQDHVPGLPKEAARAVMRALSRDPGKRFASCVEFARAFARGVADLDGQGDGTPDPPARRLSPWLAGAAALGVAAVAALLWLPRPQPAPSPPGGRVIPAWARISAAQIEVAQRLELPVAFENALGMRFVLVPEGSFAMGDETDGPVTRVTLTRPFHMQATEVTNGQFRRFRGAHDSGRIGEAPANGDDQPAVNVSWEDARAFAQWLTKIDGREYRLPTEAEWEYACRAGTQSAYAFGDEDLARHANAAGAAPQGDGLDVFPGTAPVGTFPPNAWGLHDFHGNAAEWCADWFGPPPGGSATDPAGPASGRQRVRRGGSWYSDPEGLRAGARASDPPHARSAETGFRLVAPAPSRATVPSPAPDAPPAVPMEPPSPPPDPPVRAPTVVEVPVAARPSVPPPEEVSSASQDPPSAAPRPFEPTPWQVEGARAFETPPVYENALGQRFVFVPAGEYVRGAPPSEAGRDDGEVQHLVRITKPFYVQTTEVTNAQFRRFRPSHRSGARAGHSLDGESQPVTRIAWADADAFAHWLTEQTGLLHRLPTEAEWEYACRAGSTTPFPWGADPAAGPRHANGSDPVTREQGITESAGWPGDDGFRVTAPVGSYPPNAWGVHDMIGNVWEWVRDRAQVYPTGAVTDPTGAAEGDLRILRGGGYMAPVSALRSAFRLPYRPDMDDDDNGFRLVIPLFLDDPAPPVGPSPTGLDRQR
jgi:formylglycine-generating enzyme required for sulfatase activity